MTEFSMWDDAAAQITTARTRHGAALAVAAAEPLWPYLAQARDQAEFAARLDLSADNLGRMLTEAGLDPQHAPAATQALSQRFAAHLRARSAHEVDQARRSALRASAAAAASQVAAGLKVAGETEYWVIKNSVGQDWGKWCESEEEAQAALDDLRESYATKGLHNLMPDPAGFSVQKATGLSTAISFKTANDDGIERGADWERMMTSRLHTAEQRAKPTNVQDTYNHNSGSSGEYQKATCGNCGTPLRRKGGGAGKWQHAGTNTGTCPEKKTGAVAALLASVDYLRETDWIEAEASFFSHPQPAAGTSDPYAQQHTQERSDEAGFEKDKAAYFQAHPGEQHETISGGDLGTPKPRQPGFPGAAMGSRHQAAGDLASQIMSLPDGKSQMTLNGVHFVVFVNSRESQGDFGGATGDTEKDYEAFLDPSGTGDVVGLKDVARVHQSPSGGPYGNSAAPRYAAEQVAQALISAMQRHQGAKQVMAASNPKMSNPDYAAGYLNGAQDGALGNQGKFDLQNYDESSNADFAQGYYDGYDGWTMPGVPTHMQSSKQAVNTDAYGTERYQAQPITQEWAEWVSDEWDDKGDPQAAADGMAGRTVPDLVLPGVAKDTVHQHQASLGLVRQAALKVLGEDYTPVEPANLGGFASPSSDIATPHQQPKTTRPRVTPEPAKDPMANLVTVDTTIIPGQMDPPMGGPGMDGGAQMGGGGGFDMGSAATMPDAPATMMTGPMDTSYGPAQMTDPMRPSTAQRVTARIARLAARIALDNPTMAGPEVTALAARTVAAYPEMVKVAAESDGWTTTYNSYGDPIWKKTNGEARVQLWEVAARKGKFQWSGRRGDYAGGGEDWYDSKEEAQADAEAFLSPPRGFL